MLTYEDCVELSDLTEEEIEAVAQHEHLPEIVALELGSYLVHSPEGVPMIKRIILDDIEEERRLGNEKKALHPRLKGTGFRQNRKFREAREMCLARCTRPRNRFG